MLSKLAKSEGDRAKSPVASLAVVAPRAAMALGAAALPIGVFGITSGTGAATAVSAFALLIASGLGAYVALRGKKFARTASPHELAFNDLIENMRDALMQFDAQGRVTLCSNSTKDLLGCEAYELVRDGLHERIHLLERPLYMTAFAQAQQDGTQRTIEVRMRRDSAMSSAAPEFFWAEIFLSPNRTAHNQTGPFAVTATLRDVSQYKRFQVRMDQARQAAEEASLAKNRFLAVIGHELRTPLNAIVGFSDMMANGIGGKLEATHQEYVQLISQSGHHLLEMVNMLLDMSKLEAGKFELQTEYFEPEKLVAPCIQMVSKSAAEKSVELDVELGRNLPEICADERACRQILLNLLSNAIKFTDAGGKVTWTMKRHGQSLSIIVTDTGIGMSQDVLAHLGEPFFQAQNNADRGYEGTGLGMSIVKGLVELHEGRIDVKSAPGGGTSVEVLLPINGPETIMSEDETVTPLREIGVSDQSRTKPDQIYKRIA